jgi:CDP-diglyceride synthetase/membrane protease YdiL (CAAX protease family)
MPSEHPYFQDRPYVFKVIVLFAVWLFIASIAALVSTGILSMKFDVGVTTDLAQFLQDNPASVNMIKLLQIVSSIGMFLLPPLLFVFLVYKEPFKALALHKGTRKMQWLLLPFVLFFSMPVVQLLLEWNQAMSLPAFLGPIEDWMLEAESQAEALLDAFLTMHTPADLAMNLFMIGVIPAIGEELLFRGGLQQLFSKWTRNHHAAILISAFLFSAMHMQFYGFLPRFGLGVILGYMLVWSGSLWVPIVAHFLFNSSQVVLVYFTDLGQLDLDVEAGPDYGWPFTVLSIVVLALFLVIFKRSGVAQSEIATYNANIKRSLTGIVFAGVMIGGIYWHQWSLFALFFIISSICLYEFYTLTGVKNALVWTGAGAVFFIYAVGINLTGQKWFEWGPGIVALIALIVSVRQKNRNLILGMFYIGVPFAFIPFLESTSDIGSRMILAIVVMIWANDTFAYITGSLIGRTKLAPKISPKKTWEGLFGGMAGTLLVAWLLFDMGGQELLFAAGVSVIGTIGDLYESSLKRRFNVKDSGSLLPGHGGVLDRFDALIFVIPYTYFLLR